MKGIPLSKIDTLRALLEENRLELTHSSHLVDYVPLLLKHESEVSLNANTYQQYLMVLHGMLRLLPS